MLEEIDIEVILARRNLVSLETAYMQIEPEPDTWEKQYFIALLCCCAGWIGASSEKIQLEAGLQFLDKGLGAASSLIHEIESLILVAGITGLLIQKCPSQSSQWGRLHDGAIRKIKKNTKNHPRLFFWKP